VINKLIGNNRMLPEGYEADERMDKGSRNRQKRIKRLIL
jgi:hypothetical protein